MAGTPDPERIRAAEGLADQDPKATLPGSGSNTEPTGVPGVSGAPVVRPRVEPIGDRSGVVTSGIRVVFEPELGLNLPEAEVFDRLEWDWYNAFVSGPNSLNIRAMGLLADGSGYAIDVLGTDLQAAEGIAEIVRATVGPNIVGLSVGPLWA
jgi:hypothetical protein